MAITSPPLTDTVARLRLAIVRTARRMRQEALAMGFSHVEAGPLVRSSYHAWAHVGKIVEKS